MSNPLQIQTARFGEIQVTEDRIIRFVKPIIGFDQLERYVLLDHADDSPFKWLQALEDPNLAFVVTNPKFFGIPYEFSIPDDVVEILGVKSAEDVVVLTIVNVPENNPALMTANLLGPLVVNQNTRVGLQLVLNDTDFGTKTRLIPDEMLHAEANSGETSESASSGV